MRLRISLLSASLAVALLGLQGLACPQVARADQTVGPYDFNGDGYADLAVGVPGDRVGRTNDAGAVNVLYGSRRGLKAKGAELWSQGSAGIKGKPTAFESWGSVVSSGDFDCDGFADLAVTGDDGNRPRVQVLYGGRRGLTARDQVVGVSSEEVLSWSPAEYLTTGDFDADGCDELVFSVPSSVIVYDGSRRGLVRQQILSLPRSIVGEAATRFGQGLVTGDLTGDGIDDLAAGGATVDAGTGRSEGVAVIPGSARGLQSASARRLPAPTGVAASDAPFASYAYGASLAIGDFNGDSYPDLAVGDGRAGRERSAGFPTCPGASFCSGAVVVHHGSRSGLHLLPHQVWSTSTLGSGQRQSFGTHVAAGDVDGDGRDDLAVVQRWSIVVLPGRSGGLTTAGSRTWTLDSLGVKGKPFPGDRGFGCGGIRLLDHGRGSQADLSIGSPEQSNGKGTVNVLHGSHRGTTASGDQQWDQASKGVPGVAMGITDGAVSDGDWFGGSRVCTWEMS